jgi:phage FluMu protein Com
MEFNCEVCGVNAPTFDALQAHFSSTKHLKTLRKVGLGNSLKPVHQVRDPELKGKTLRCLLCNVILTEGEVSFHVGGSTHTSALEKEDERFREMDPDKWFVEVEAAERDTRSRGRYFCNFCQVASPTFSTYQIHVQGKRHLKAVKFSSSQSSGNTFGENISQFCCSICNISCTDQEALDNHFKGKKHHKALKHRGIFQKMEEEDKEETCSSSVVDNPYVPSAVTRPPRIRCTLCNVVLANSTETQAHLTTTEHYMALRKTPITAGKWLKEMFVPVY